MSEHITSNEFRQYFDILLSGTRNEEDADFVNDIDAHIAECDQCFEKMQAIRLLMQGFSSSPDLARSFINMEFPETLAKPAFDIEKVFMGIKLKIEKTVVAQRRDFEKKSIAKINLREAEAHYRKETPLLEQLKPKCGKETIQILADTVSDIMNVTFVPRRSMLAAARGDDEIRIDGSAINDLLCSDMEIPLEEGRKITLRCRNMGSSGQIRLYVYSNFEVGFILASNEDILRPEKRDFDRVVNEYVWVYKLDGQEFELTAR